MQKQINTKIKKKDESYLKEKKNKLEKLKKFPKRINCKKSGIANEAFAVVELRKLTLEKSKNINFKPIFLSKRERKKKIKKELDDKRANIRKEREEMRYIRKKFHFQYEDFENDQEFEKLKSNAKNEDVETQNVAQEMELQLIQKAYLGKKRKKKIVPPSQKFKFNFDWDAKDDTSEAYNDLYKKKAIVSLLSGRGTIAGYDQDEQLNKNKKTWSGLIGERKPITNPKVAPSLHEILRERRKTFKETQKLKKRQKERDNRHWTKKKY